MRNVKSVVIGITISLVVSQSRFVFYLILAASQRQLNLWRELNVNKLILCCGGTGFNLTRCTHTDGCILIYRVSQEECARLRESVPYVKVYRYNPKHLYPKLNGYGDNGQRKVRSSCGSTYCTFSADALHVLCACRWDWNAVNIMPACPCKVLGTLRLTTALMRVFM